MEGDEIPPIPIHILRLSTPQRKTTRKNTHPTLELRLRLLRLSRMARMLRSISELMILVKAGMSLCTCMMYCILILVLYIYGIFWPHVWTLRFLQERWLTWKWNELERPSIGLCPRLWFLCAPCISFREAGTRTLNVLILSQFFLDSISL